MVLGKKKKVTPLPIADSEEVELEDESVEQIEAELEAGEKLEKLVPPRIIYLSNSEMLREILIGVQNNRAFLEKILELAKE